MKICFMCDLHLPFDKNALQYDALEWAIEDIKKKNTDCVVYVGDITCDGNESIYDEFIEKMNGIGIPFIYIPGNSDLRDKESADSIKNKTSQCKNVFDDAMIFAVNDCDMRISDEQLSVLDDADENSVVFMHYPMKTHYDDVREKLLSWRETHPDTMVFHAHLHKSYEKDNVVSLQTLDPDKSIGENPCITYYDTLTREVRKMYYFCPVPNDIYDYFGISCYKAEKQIEFAIKKKLRHLELRPGCADMDRKLLADLIGKWRKKGGETLSLHLPDVVWSEGKIAENEKLDTLLEIINELKADRITQHVPKVLVKDINENPFVLEEIALYMAEKLNCVKHEIVVGIENMHMTKNDEPGENRRFGYTPEECLLFMQMLGEKCPHKVGINFDIGHARNNAPYSQKFQIGTWLSMLGKYIVGYHIHQVNYEQRIYENHVAITDVYGYLISYASLFKCWTIGKINKAPVIFEMRGEDAYETTLKTFDVHKKRKIFDIHSHTDYSNCGRDNPHDLIAKAIENGVKLFGICDHNYGIGDRKREYYEKIRAISKEYEDKIKILCGIEIATLPHLFDMEDSKIIKDFDYCLIENLLDENSIVKGNLFEFCKELGILCGIAHTDLFAYCDMYGIDYKEFFGKMAENNIFWEMNVSYDSIHKYREHKYVTEFMNDSKKHMIVIDAGVHISIGFDSHRCEDYYAIKIYQMYDFLKKKKFKTADALFDV